MVKEIREITENREDFMDILLIGDEQADMVQKYLNKGALYTLYEDNILKSICHILIKNKDTLEIKNLATYPKFQNKGCASKLLEFIFKKYEETYSFIILGTGENEKTLNFYKKRGFIEFSRHKDFFIKNYDHPIFENEVQLKDMIYLKKRL